MMKWGNWFILKTGGVSENDKLIICNNNLSTCNDYEFTPEKIEKEELWSNTNINSLLVYCCSEVYIKEIDNRIIKLSYKYRISEEQSDKYETKTLIYSFDIKSGKPILIKIF